MKESVKKEIKKQLIDQPLHLLMGIISVCFFTWCFKGNVYLAVGFTIAWEAAREYIQWPPNPNRPWDPPLDWVFEAVGIYLGYLAALKWVV